MTGYFGLVGGGVALVGEREKALDWVERWVDRGSINYPMLANDDPRVERLRRERRFQRLRDRVRPSGNASSPAFSLVLDAIMCFEDTVTRGKSREVPPFPGSGFAPAHGPYCRRLGNNRLQPATTRYLG
jgi:hypothetical protein